MTVVICPGFHHPSLTTAFQTAIWQPTDRIIHPVLVVPPSSVVYSGFHILSWVRQHLGPVEATPALMWIGFSAGVVGAMTAAWLWQRSGGSVRSLIALDGWGVPLWGQFPMHRVSHDFLTHWSSALLGAGQDSFYADPPVSHLELWRSPHTVQGQGISSSSGQASKPMTAAEFIRLQLRHYGELA